VNSVSIIIPAYNEQEGIGDVLDGIIETMEKSGIGHEVIVVDDGSTDGTAEIAQRKGVKVIQHALNKGYGAALKTGIRHAKYDVIVTTDADGTYPGEEIPRLVNHIDEYDMVVGARMGANVHIPPLRRPVKWVLARFGNYVAGMRIPDLNSGLRALRKEVALRFFHMLPDGFSFTTTLTLAILTSSYNVAYVPIDYHRRVGRSKINPIADTMNFLSLVARMALYFRPLRVFLPPGMFFALLSLSKLGYDAIVYNFSLRGTTLALLVITLEIFLLAFVADLIVAQR
jgi:glycosyltransferase involved in cell wall biosynthesis